MSGSRERILARVRAALADVPRDERPGDVDVPRDYAREHGQGELIPVLTDRLLDYRALVHRVTAAELPGAIAAALARRGAARVVVPPGLPDAWLGEAGPVAVPDRPLDVAELDAVDGVLTGCAVAIAETGTIVLDAGPDQGRRAITLVPDYHLCVVPAERVVASVPQALPRLDPRRPLTWISGPSATSDIELNRVEGVHGPRTLEVVIVAG
ncbi:LutC/YkgG family protein [Marinitenerispora sediminis]|uniref:Lactate utilization protein C n=1 Tax=Marinitenerispora sediminis TaxID=1931232 RepID=A0A368T4M3_9ACTN|nr:lactate utilization protein C [Marinitenerispora sediminis]RCV49320.1 lactate utilization protein C [Marinitenerispora sediminis]RCV52343.1 lactate utilization protein C [Marinitenerispora sediminis]RCV58249.1 lactate utilization protein C [Marinitenerispora sediminis]